jgi:NADH-quinone oxidoreductase subunit E
MSNLAHPGVRTGTAPKERKPASPERLSRKKLDQNDNVLTGIELLSEFNSIGLDEPAPKMQLRNILAESIASPSQLKKAERLRQLAEELRKVDTIIDKYGGDKEALIQILLDINALNHWLPKTSLTWVSTRLGVPLTQIYHAASFYKVFSLVPQGRHIIQVCLGTACQVRNAPRLLDRVLDSLQLSSPGSDPELKFTLKTVNCLGCCALGPVMTVDDNDHYSNPSSEQLKQILAKYN